MKFGVTYKLVRCCTCATSCPILDCLLCIHAQEIVNHVTFTYAILTSGAINLPTEEADENIIQAT